MSPPRDPNRLCTYCGRRTVRPNSKGAARNDCKRCHADYQYILRQFGSLLIYWSYRNSLDRPPKMIRR